MDISSIKISKEIKSGMKLNKPIVALESTLISHGLPYPENINVAQSSIEAVKKNGSIPATIGIINGKIKVGLNKKDINILGKSKNTHKISKHNLPLAINNKYNAGTTIASSIYIASKIGIKFFATGGIGGVHLDAEKTFDVSSDLYELSRNNMYIICSGAKSILDINKTYEKLESLSILRIGYKTNYMPGFWYNQTDKKVDFNFNNIKKLNSFLHTCKKNKIQNSILILNCVPKNDAIKKNLVQNWIKKALIKGKNNSIEGKELTPFLIKEVNLLSKNQCLKSNISLIINNASLAGKLAKNYY